MVDQGHTEGLNNSGQVLRFPLKTMLVAEMVVCAWCPSMAWHPFQGEFPSSISRMDSNK